ncbi:MAG: efflux RND transporter periplasmic adaptor subunit [Gammaproteobacteria bacterium]
MKEVTQWDEFSGHIEAVETVEIRPRVAGYIERLSFKHGKEVKKGEVLFVMDQRPFQAELMRAEAELARVRARSVPDSGVLRRHPEMGGTRARAQWIVSRTFPCRANDRLRGTSINSKCPAV